MTQAAFQYQAIDRRGERTRGVMRASSVSEAYRQVRAAGLQPLRIRAVKARAGRQRAVTLRDLSHFTHQFSVLMEARIPIVDGLNSIAEQEANSRLRMIIYDIAKSIAAGNGVTEAMQPHREVFGDVYLETTRAAERTGNMTAVLASLAEMLERQYEINKNVRGALMYPVCVSCTLVLAVAFLMGFVVPRFAALFANRNVPLPVATQMLIDISAFIRTWWPLLVGTFVLGLVGLKRSWRDRRWRGRIDTALHRVPLLRDILRGLALSRFATILGISLRSGLSLLEALDMAGRASARPLLIADAEKMREQVNYGGRLADVLLTCNYLPPFTRRMLTAGEEAAELSKMCVIVARHYDREVGHMTRNVATVIEPILIVALAGVVLFVALAIFLPIWNMASLVG